MELNGKTYLLFYFMELATAKADKLPFNESGVAIICISITSLYYVLNRISSLTVKNNNKRVDTIVKRNFSPINRRRV